MVKIYTGFTNEVDDPEQAVREIVEQLKPQENMLKNAVGIIHFYHDFYETGVYQAVVDALPFDLAGCVTTSTATNGVNGNFSLIVTMITSDDVSFKISTVADLLNKSREQVFDEVKALFEELGSGEQPKLVMPYMPPLKHFGGDDLVDIANGLDSPFPLFGGFAFHDMFLSEAYLVVGKSLAASDAFAFVSFYGQVDPKFHVTSAFAAQISMGESVEITDAEGPTLKTVNGITAVEYLKKQGIITGDNAVANQGMWAVPALLTYPDGTKVVRAFLGIVPDTDYVLSTATLRIGAKITFALLDGEKTIESAEMLMSEIRAALENNTMIYSCCARSWSLGAQTDAEANKIAEGADAYMQENGAPLKYSMAYSGGEICPVIGPDGKLANVLHNYSLTACSLS